MITRRKRFSRIKKKWYCIQCLYLGNIQDKGNHVESKSQHNFVSEHMSHHESSVNKHILVYNEHKIAKKNEESLQKFKEKFIARQQVNFLARCISMKLFFHFNKLYQKWKTMKKTLLVYSKISDCFDMVSSYQAAESIRNRAIQELSGPI